MNYKQPIILGLLPVLSLLGQANDSNADRATLDEIAVTKDQVFPSLIFPALRF